MNTETKKLNDTDTDESNLLFPLSVVLPYFRPPEDWAYYVTEAYKQIYKHLGFHPELIIVNDGSNPPSNENLLRLKHTIPHFRFTGYPENKGKGAALRYGISKAKGAKIIFTDIDFPYTSKSFIDIWEGLKEADVVIGVKDKNYYQHVPRTRVFISKILRKFIGILFRIPITDTQCGLKGFNQKGRKIFLKTTINRYLCDLEFVYQCFQDKTGIKTVSQPVCLRPEVEFSSMNMKILLSELFNLLTIVLKIKQKKN